MGKPFSEQLKAMGWESNEGYAELQKPKQKEPGSSHRQRGLRRATAWVAAASGPSGTERSGTAGQRPASPASRATGTSPSVPGSCSPQLSPERTGQAKAGVGKVGAGLPSPVARSTPRPNPAHDFSHNKRSDPDHDHGPQGTR